MYILVFSSANQPVLSLTSLGLLTTLGINVWFGGLNTLLCRVGETWDLRKLSASALKAFLNQVKHSNIRIMLTDKTAQELCTENK
jgi:hypothetical protein